MTQKYLLFFKLSLAQETCQSLLRIKKVKVKCNLFLVLIDTFLIIDTFLGTNSIGRSSNAV